MALEDDLNIKRIQTLAKVIDWTKQFDVHGDEASLEVATQSLQVAFYIIRSFDPPTPIQKTVLLRHVARVIRYLETLP